MNFVCERCKVKLKIEAEKDDGGAVEVTESLVVYCPLCGNIIATAPSSAAEAAEKGFDTIHTDSGKQPPTREKSKET